MIALSEETLRAAQRGDPAANSELYRRLSPAVHGYFVSRGVEDPEGLTSEVFLALIPRLGSVTGGVSGLRTLTFSIAHARVVDEIRRRARQPVQLPYEPETDRRTSPSAESDAIANRQHEGALTLLATLPPDQAEVLRLRILGDLSIAQTAAILGRSEGAVKQLQRRALLTLKAAVVDQGVTR